MTDKEQIIIDGVNVSRCKYLPYCNDKQGNCAFEPNCYFKQLARKTQEYNELLEQHKELDDRVNRMIEEKYNLARECEELENKIKKLRKNLALEIEANDRYRKALEEIEENIKSYCKDMCMAETKETYEICQNTNILNIINKAKGEENAR